MPLDPGTVEAAINGQMDRGDREAAVTEGIRAYGPQLLGYLVTVLRDVESAREVFAQVCENLWRGIAAFRRESTFRAWAYHVAYNAAQDHLRDPFRRRGRRLATEEVSKLIAAVPTPTPPAARTSVRGRIDALRAELSPDEQTLLTLRVNRRLSWAEVAEVLARPEHRDTEAALRKRYERIVRRVREMASARGLLE